MRPASGALSRGDFLQGIGRFAAAGLFSTGLYFAVTNLLIALAGTAPFVASLIAYCVCIVSSFLLQSKMVFRYSGNRNRAIAKFGLLSLLGLVAAQSIFWLSVERLGFSPVVASVFVSIAIPIINFMAMNFWVFVEGSLVK